MNKCGFSTDLKQVNKVQNPEALRNWCRSMKDKLVADTSNYAKGRYRLWLFHEVDFRNGKLTKSYFDERIWNFSQRVYPNCNIGLLTFGGRFNNGKVSDGRIGLHRDHTYAKPKTISINLGEAIFSYGEPNLTDYLLKDGDILKFNCKVLHGLKQIKSPERFSLVFWQLNEQKGYNSIL